jgi:hypothetical protein
MAKVLKSEIMQGIKTITPKTGGKPLKCFAVNLRLPSLQNASSYFIALTLWEKAAEAFHQHMTNDVNGSGDARDYIIYQLEVRTPWKLYKPSVEFLKWHEGAVANLTYTRGLDVFLDSAIPSIYDFNDLTERFVFEESPELLVVHPDRWDLDMLDAREVVMNLKNITSPTKECIFKIRTTASKRARSEDEDKDSNELKKHSPEEMDSNTNSLRDSLLNQNLGFNTSPTPVQERNLPLSVKLPAGKGSSRKQ